jgi:hypothetical protein
MQRDLQVDLGRYQDNKRAQCVRETLGLEMGLEKRCAQNFAVRSIAPQREAPTVILGKTVPGNSQTKAETN